MKGLLPADLLEIAYEKILGGDNGRMLATGTDEDKQKVVKRFLPLDEP